jgi:hypothetical protein
MHHRWQPIHCDRCLEEQLSEELSQVAISPRQKHICSHGSTRAKECDLIWSGYSPFPDTPESHHMGARIIYSRS